jgi:hypothetical protein
MKFTSHHGVHRPKPSEDYVTHNVTKSRKHHDGEDKNEGEDIELKEIDETKDKDYYFVDTTLIGSHIIERIKLITMLISFSW